MALSFARIRLRQSVIRAKMKLSPSLFILGLRKADTRADMDQVRCVTQIAG